MERIIDLEALALASGLTMAINGATVTYDKATGTFTELTGVFAQTLGGHEVAACTPAQRLDLLEQLAQGLSAAGRGVSLGYLTPEPGASAAINQLWETRNAAELAASRRRFFTSLSEA